MRQCRAYHAGQNYYVEVDIVMDEATPLKVTHDVSQTLQRKLEGEFLGTREMCFQAELILNRSCRRRKSIRTCRLRRRSRHP
jgi:divalent metal cation (Fe/Co/Zn/Cd) transporter